MTNQQKLNDIREIIAIDNYSRSYDGLFNVRKMAVNKTIHNLAKKGLYYKDECPHEDRGPLGTCKNYETKECKEWSNKNGRTVCWALVPLTELIKESEKIMKYWIEAVLEPKDGKQKCFNCLKELKTDDHLFVEFKIIQGDMPHPNELHPEPTGRKICIACSERYLQ